MSFEVKQRRIVPNKNGYQHAGQNAALVMCEVGFRAWGFGDTPTAAQTDAVKKVVMLKRKSSGVPVEE